MNFIIRFQIPAGLIVLRAGHFCFQLKVKNNPSNMLTLSAIFYLAGLLFGHSCVPCIA